MAAKPAGKLPAILKPASPAPKATKATKGAGARSTPPPPPKRHKTDWDAVERDYRTGKYTETELATKYGISRSAVNKQARTKHWQKDLRQEIKQATNARLVSELVAKEVAESGKKVADTVLVAAEVSARVITGHRDDIKAARNLAIDLMQELAETKLLNEDKEALAQVLAGDNEDAQDRARSSLRKVLDVHARINSVKSLADTLTKLQTLERQAFDLDNAPATTEDPLQTLLNEISRGQGGNSFKPVQVLPDDDED